MLVCMASTAAMADGLNLNWREARVVKLAKPATSIVVGDPTVADVTLDTPDTMIVFGKTPGSRPISWSSAATRSCCWIGRSVVSPVTARHVSRAQCDGRFRGADRGALCLRHRALHPGAVADRRPVQLFGQQLDQQRYRCFEVRLLLGEQPRVRLRSQSDR